MDRLKEIFDQMFWGTIGLAIFIGFLTFNDWYRVSYWQPAIASIESINEVCEFSVHRIWNKNSTYSYIYCSNSQATQKLVK
ncbi:MAG: hypothetical protein WCE69_05725, partial [Aestuariivirga sp.]